MLLLPSVLHSFDIQTAAYGMVKEGFDTKISSTSHGVVASMVRFGLGAYGTDIFIERVPSLFIIM